jgi:hypothetical protein
MRKLKLLFITCFLFLITSFGCNRGNENRVRIESNKEFDFLLIDSVFSKIRFIPLETKAECLIGSITLSNRENRVYVYNESGCFVRKLELPFHVESFAKTDEWQEKSKNPGVLEMFNTLKKTDLPNPVIVELKSI